MTASSPPARRRPRPHPARRARKIAGTVSVAGMVLLTGCMAVAGKSSSGTAATTTGTTANTTATTGTTATMASTAPPAASSDSTSVSQTVTPAVSGTVSSQTDTSSHGS